MIYLDNAATTQMDERVLEAMMPYLTTEYGNAGTLYKFGRAANEAVQKARTQVAALINAEPEQIIFTSGGSEANNLVFRGLKDYLKSIGKTHILVSAVEHDSVLRAAESLIKDGFHVEYIPVSSECRVSPAVIEDALRADTGLVSVMFANNETGAINPIEDIGTICMKRGILFHTDCVQAAGCYPIDVVKIGCDFLSVSSHKIHGCKGIGALYTKDKSKLTPIVYGGSEQEFGLRGGTENVAGTDVSVKVALLLHDIGKPQCYTEDENGGHFHGHGVPSRDIAEQVLDRLRFDNKTKQEVLELVLYHDTMIEPTPRTVRKWLHKLGERRFSQFLDVRMADILAHAEGTQESRIERCIALGSIMSEVLEAEQCFALKDLQINGRDIMNLGIEQGKRVGEILNSLLDEVISGALENEHNALMQRAVELLG